MLPMIKHLLKKKEYKFCRSAFWPSPLAAVFTKWIGIFGIRCFVRRKSNRNICLGFDECHLDWDWPFDDGAPPPGEIVEDWLNLLKTKFREEPGCCVAVHCVAGLGRAPVLVALALIECGMKYEDAVQFIRQKRRGAFNSKQLLYLEKYRPKMRLRFRDANGHCIVQ
ncbi:protein tyrosine phosphatase type IVA 2 isoform X5 [Ahaetulla prasina]|uniref:protein tyrosine phosphatase type IVA 2 isoform X5 n=1 Tax=Ahaetulla prasina TaxID=499056 RepID=UPI002647C927|nr:protein tyrosine phosphatase type IVA 2 isoform X5 [Ahaetulla prasina]XP_058051311.1 protein tyrosine phosphatase type IVA 2 isoform X5 [Ahaetulla prasina]